MQSRFAATWCFADGVLLAVLCGFVAFECLALFEFLCGTLYLRLGECLEFGFFFGQCVAAL